jgi:hypothetical protein
MTRVGPPYDVQPVAESLCAYALGTEGIQWFELFGLFEYLFEL